MREALLAMAAAVVEDWAYTRSPQRDALIVAAGWTSGRHTLDPGFLTGDRWKAPRLASSLWATGINVITALDVIRTPATTQFWRQDMLVGLSQPSLTWAWERGHYERDYREFYRSGGAELEQARRRDHGPFDPDWLRHTHITAKGSALLRSDGSFFTTTKLRPLGEGVRLCDYVEWQWIAPFRMRFRPVTVAYPMSNIQARLFAELCDAIVGNFPAVLRRPLSADALRLYPSCSNRDIEARWCDGGAAIELLVCGLPVATHRVQRQHDLTVLRPVSIEDDIVQLSFQCSTRLTKRVQPLAGAAPWRASGRRLRRGLRAHAKEARLAARDVRTAQWQSDDPEIADALATLGWKPLVRAAGVSAQDTEFWHKFRLHQTYSWTRAEESSCPVEGCQEDDYRTPASEKAAIFGWYTPPSQYDWVAAVQKELDLDATELARAAVRVEHWADMAWRHLVTGTARHLWSSHAAAMCDPDASPVADDSRLALARWSRSFSALLEWGTSDRVDRTILKLFSSLTAPDTILRVVISAARYLLFFDGGSRGNPGRGGSGSVIVRVRHGFELVWAAAMSFAAKTTTNNLAEFQGLCTGLSAAVARGWHPLTVIGDSAMILSLMRRRRQPRARSLQPLFLQARQATATLRVTEWHHHYRTHNKMADKAANVAMDARRSFQAFASDPRPELATIAQFLSNDTGPWIDRLLASNSAPDRVAGL